jgi:diguanylate cyclase (GGDEF)-like protein
MARDVAAEARDAASAWDGAAREVAGDRVAAALDRHAAALRAATESAIDIAVEVRLATASVVREEKRAADARDAAADDRFEAALDRDDAADDLLHAYRDDLTGALLRDPGCEQLSAAIDRAHRTGEPFVVAFLDVDNLKSVNDGAGHGAGDMLLRAVGTALRVGLRSYDIVVRYGGDEFVCALPGGTAAVARESLVRVRAALDRMAPGATVSAGYAEVMPDETLGDVIRRADTDLYRARRLRHTSAPLGAVGDREHGVRSTSVACGECGGRIALSDFVLELTARMTRAADCAGCGATTVIQLAGGR